MSALTAPAVRSAAEAVAHRFVEARLARRALADYPGDLPQDMATAYATQDAAIAAYPDEIVAWKVGMVPPALQDRLGTHRVAGPIFARNLWIATDEPTPLPAFVGGFAAVEAEFVARVGRIDPEQVDWSIEQAVAAIEALHVGVEFAGSPLKTINDLGSAVVASDFGNNAGLVLGAEISNWATRLDEIQVETIVDGTVVGNGMAASIPRGILESVRFLLEHCARSGRPLAAGALISTGAVTGVHEVVPGAVSACSFSSVSTIHCRVVPALP